MKALTLLALLVSSSASATAPFMDASYDVATCRIGWWLQVPWAETRLDDVPLQADIMLPLVHSTHDTRADTTPIVVTVVGGQGAEVEGTVRWAPDVYLGTELLVWTPSAPLAAEASYTLRIRVDPPDPIANPGCVFEAIDHTLALHTGDGVPSTNATLRIEALVTGDTLACVGEGQRLERRVSGRVSYTLGPGGPRYHVLRATGSSIETLEGDRFLEDGQGVDIDDTSYLEVGTPPAPACLHLELYSLLEARVLATTDGCSDVAAHVPAQPLNCTASPDAGAEIADGARPASDDGCGSARVGLMFWGTTLFGLWSRRGFGRSTRVTRSRS